MQQPGTSCAALLHNLGSYPAQSVQQCCRRLAVMLRKFGNHAAEVLQQCCHQCAAMLSVWQLYAYRPYSYYGQELEN